ncbi:MAG: VCBS repeat-containing protein [Candidatus Eisenbacteria bacterium]|nr:VCBS repeat-containing protein [Candidatus Eisenbacteria bacterium]
MAMLHRARAPRAVLALLPMLLMGAASAHAACTGLAAAVPYPAGTGARMVVRDDFDRDGIDDLATANGTGAALSVMLGLGANGKGNGAFAAPVSYALGATGMGLWSGDFSGDGIPDIAVAVSAGVVTWRGTGSGTFVDGTLVAAGSGVRGVVSADFDRDGVADLALASSSTNNVLVLRGTGGGAFAAPVAFAAGGAPTRIVCADFDDDGRFDLACSNNTTGSVSVFRGDGGGGFAAAVNVAAPGSPWGLAVTDADRDGHADLLVGNGAGSTVTLLRGDGAAGFTSAGSFATPLAPRDLGVADFDGDGTADVAMACAGTNQVSVLRGTGSGYALPTSTAAGAGAAGVCVGDFNGDGAPDLACANTTANSVSRHLGTCPAPAGAAVTLLSPNGGETWWPGAEPVVRWSRGAGVASVDLDLSRDGGATWLPLARGATGERLTIRASGASSGVMRVRVRDSAVSARADTSDEPFAVCGLFREAVRTPLGFAATQLERADLDGDGLEDAVAASATHAAVLRGTGTGAFAPGAPFDVDASRRMRLADVNADGLADLVTLGAGTLAWRAGDGAGAFALPRLVAQSGGVDFVAGDFDADGRADAALLVSDAAGARLVVRCSATTPFDREWSAPVTGAPQQLVAADLDGDGITDLAVATAGELQLWRGGGAAGRGDGRFALATTRALPGGAGELSVGDFDRDGRLDVAACARVTSDVWTLGTSSVLPATELVLGTPTASHAGDTPRSPVVADFDGDDRADMAVIAPGAAQVRVLGGTDAGFSPPASFAGGTGALLAGDFLRDGAADLLVARPESSDVLCLPAQCPPRGAAQVRLKSRHAGERWSVGFARPVAWSRTGAVALARVELSRDGGAHWTPVSSAMVDSQLTIVVSGPATAHARVRVCDATSSTRADESAEFAIVEPFASAERVIEPLLAASGTALALGTPRADGTSDAALVAGGRVTLAHGLSSSEDVGETGVQRALLTDLDGDGHDELVTMTANALRVRRGLGDGGFGVARTLATAGANAALLTGDFDEDGIPDLAAACGVSPAQRVMLWRGLGVDVDSRMAFGGATQVAIPSPATAMTRADVNGDGITDLVVAHAGGLSTLLGNGSAGRGNGVFRVAGTRAFGAGAVCALVCADFDGDGHPDVAGADSTLGALLVSAGDGAGGFASAITVARAPRAADLAWGDFDGDALADIALASPTGVALLRGSGRVAAGGFAPAGVVSTDRAPRALVLRDTDGDGACEIVVLDGERGALAIISGASSAAGPVTLDSPAALHPTVGAELELHWSGLLAADLDVTYDEGAHWLPLARGVQGGAFAWTVSGPPAGLARVRVRDTFAPVRGDTTAAFAIEPVTLGVAPALPRLALLGRATPNPSRDVTTLELALPRSGEARIEVCDVAGRAVRLLHRGALAAGAHTLAWDGRGDSGDPLPPGAYFVRARVAGADLARKVVRVR